MNKFCTRCKENKDVSLFHKRTYKTGTVSYQSNCAQCVSDTIRAKNNKTIKNLQGEYWVPVPSTNNEYFVSNMYRIKSVKNEGEKIINLTYCNGYARFITSINSKKKTFLFHRILAILFIQNPNNYPFINHKDLNRANYLLSNLEWCTASQNVIHAIANGRCKKTKFSAGGRKLTDVQILDIYNSEIHYAELSKMYGVTATSIANIKMGYKWGHITGGVPKSNSIKNKGLYNGQSKLSSEKVLEIIKGGKSICEYAKDYCVDRKTIVSVLKGNTWGWLTGIKKINVINQ